MLQLQRKEVGDELKFNEDKNDEGEKYGGKKGESGEFRMYNCSDIERVCFESVGYWMTYIFKGMAHGSWNDATYCDGSFGMDRWLVKVTTKVPIL